ncbi:hypothetical protein LTS17_007169 [Exophiala oligosperma]
MARKLLMLGSFLQSIAPKTIKELGAEGIRLDEIMTNAVEIVNRLVTSNDDLICSVEGIECIMIESMYQNNAGNLRQAWLTNRRAMGIAEMLRLHDRNSRCATVLGVETRDRIDTEYMWLRLVTSDRYLSLMLGLPQGSLESPFAGPKAFEGCPALERLERLESLIGGLIIQRNKEDLHNLEATHKIDKLLQDAEFTMPARWWLFPESETKPGSDTEAFMETIRIINHFSHYHLLVQLHLPFLLRSSVDDKCDYSKITAVNASREILSRFRSTDRGLMERTLKIMEDMAQTNDDDIALRIAHILQRLLTVEAAVANGGSYNASLMATPAEHDNLLSGSGHDSSGDVLRINVPHIGTFQIEPAGSARHEQRSRDGDIPPSSVLKTTSSGTDCIRGRVPPFTSAEDQFLPRTFTNGVYGQHTGAGSIHSNSLGEGVCDINEGDVDLEGRSMPASDDWTLQGVDITLFENLFDDQGEFL